MRDCFANCTEQDSSDNVDSARAQEHHQNSPRDTLMTRKRRYEDLT